MELSKKERKIYKILLILPFIIIFIFFISLSIYEKSKKEQYLKQKESLERYLKKIDEDFLRWKEEWEQKTWKPDEKEKYFLNEIINHSNGILLYGFWSQKETAYIQINSAIAKDKKQAEEIADYCAKYLAKALNRFICVRLYIGNQRQVARSCKSP